MQFSLQYHQDQGIFEVKTNGEAEVERFCDFMKAIVDHEKWKPGSPVLVDNTKLNAAPLTIDGVKTIANFCEQHRAQFGHAKCALLASRDLEFGLTRMWQVFVSVDVWDVSEKLFKSRDEALAWLSL
jgi:hypothetical protein